MIGFIKNLQIRYKLSLLLLLLVIPLIYFVIENISQKINENNDLKDIYIKLNESERISELIHVFQVERSRVIASSYGDSSFITGARQQRLITDAAIRNLQVFLEEEDIVFPGLSLANDLQRFRDQQDKKNFDIEEFQAYADNLITTYLTRIEENAKTFSNVDVRRKLMGFKDLVDSKIYLGKTRSTLMKVIQQDGFSFQDYASLSIDEDFFNASLQRFVAYASAEASKEVLNLTTADNHKQVLNLFMLFENNPQIDLTPYNQRAIYNLFTNSINDFRNAEALLISSIKNEVQEQIAAKEASFTSLIILMVIVLGIAFSYAVFIIRYISSSISALRFAAEKVQRGDTNVAISFVSNDEIGELAASFRGVIYKNLSLSKVAMAIGEEDYDVEVEVQGPEDSLSLAILEMKDNLARFSKLNASRNWILTGTSELNNIISSEKEIKLGSEKIIEFLCEYTSSEIGVFFLNNDAGALVAFSGYGVQTDEGNVPSFMLGEGKIGQAATENKIINLQEVSDDYLKIKTGVSSIDPVNILILPVVYASSIIGVIELGSRKKYDEDHLDFLRIAAEKAGVFFFTLQSHLQTQKLLFETQNQAEELETQQEELRQMNAELKASEEELKVSQEELQEKNAELEEKAQLLEEQFEAVGAKNKDLEDAKEAIELKIKQVETVSKYKSEFLANMSHELRTPLNSILILSNLLADNPDKRLSDKQVEHAHIINRSGGDLLKLINEILDLSKIESGMIKLDVEEIDIDSLDIESAFRELANSKKISLKVNKSEDVQSIFTDKFRLEQVLKNFLSNAFKFTEDGGAVSVDIFTVRERINFSAESLHEADEIIAFSVHDSGIGIVPEKLDIIFEAFEQADASTTRKYGGTGLGLAISKEISILLGGEIRVESEIGNGSTFTLYLPRQLKPESLKQEPEERSSVPIIFKSKESIDRVMEAVADSKPSERLVSVLIIEDDKGFNNILADFAKAKNFKVTQAYSGNEGFDLAKSTQPDAIMLDINLPDTSGWNILQRIREDKDLRHVSVHVMSAYDKTVTEGCSSNDEYLAKPITLEMLNSAFNTISSITDNSIEKILIVEDNEIENHAIAELLQVHDIESASAFSAEMAEEILGRQKVDCIILDLNLPGMKGYDWMKKIRATKGLSDIPIIIYSGKELDEAEEIKIKKFANTVIIKNEHSYLRLLDEVQLFLHKINQKLPFGRDYKIKLHNPEEILRDKKVLIVDDDVRNVYSLSSLLERQKMQIFVAYNGKEAISLLNNQEGIDIVLMDVMMPEMDGIEATRTIRRDSRFKKLPIIALTAKAMKEDREKCIEAGASDYIPKPVDSEKLQTLMRVWLYEA